MTPATSQSAGGRLCVRAIWPSFASWRIVASAFDSCAGGGPNSRSVG
jgi:hypothetical protein